ncbi:hypothetical protein THAOC_23061, partial [Thalassiosira oceanica]
RLPVPHRHAATVPRTAGEDEDGRRRPRPGAVPPSSGTRDGAAEETDETEARARERSGRAAARSLPGSGEGRARVRRTRPASAARAPSRPGDGGGGGGGRRGLEDGCPAGGGGGGRTPSLAPRGGDGSE